MAAQVRDTFERMAAEETTAYARACRKAGRPLDTEMRGTTMPRPKSDGSRWTPEDDAILREFAHEGRSGVAKRTGRSPSSVMNRAHALGVTLGGGRGARPSAAAQASGQVETSSFAASSEEPKQEADEREELLRGELAIVHLALSRERLARLLEWLERIDDVDELLHGQVDSALESLKRACELLAVVS